MQTGKRLFSSASTAEVIVIRGATVELLCAGAPMTESVPAVNGAASPAAADPVELGKRYEDTESGLVVMCTKPGTGPLSVDGRTLAAVKAKPLPSSD